MMDELEVPTAETVISEDAQTSTPPEPVIDGQPQEGVQEPRTDGEKVEPPAPQQVQPTSERPVQRQPSQYYKERKEIRDLKTQISQLTQLVQKISEAPTSSKQAEKQEELNNIFEDPQKYVDQNISNIKKAIEDFKNEIPTLIKRHEESKLYVSEVDQAMETMFPKEQEGDTWQTVLERNPERQDAFAKFFKDNPWVAEMAVKYPLQAAQQAMKQLGLDKPASKPEVKNPLVPKKTQMSSTQSSVGVGAKGKKITSEDAQKQFAQLADELSRNPGDEGVLKRFAELETILENSLKKD